MISIKRNRFAGETVPLGWNDLGTGHSGDGVSTFVRFRAIGSGTNASDLMRRIDLLGVDEVGDGEMKMVWVDGTDQVLVINTGGDFKAIQGVCSHEYFELDKGFLTAGTITCALHLSRFDLSDGEPLDPPAELPLEVYPVVIENGRVLIEVPDGPLPISEE